MSQVRYYGELMQSVFVLLVLQAALLLSFEDDRHPVNLRIQLFVVYTIIVAILFEWLLVMVGIILWIIQQFRKKKVDKQKLQIATQYIFYKQDPSDILCVQCCKDKSQVGGSDASSMNQVAARPSSRPQDAEQDPFDDQQPNIDNSSSHLNQENPSENSSPFKPPLIPRQQLKKGVKKYLSMYGSGNRNTRLFTSKVENKIPEQEFEEKEME